MVVIHEFDIHTPIFFTLVLTLVFANRHVMLDSMVALMQKKPETKTKDEGTHLFPPSPPSPIYNSRFLR